MGQILSDTSKTGRDKIKEISQIANDQGISVEDLASNTQLTRDQIEAELSRPWAQQEGIAVPGFEPPDGSPPGAPQVPGVPSPSQGAPGIQTPNWEGDVESNADLRDRAAWGTTNIPGAGMEAASADMQGTLTPDQDIQQIPGPQGAQDPQQVQISELDAAEAELSQGVSPDEVGATQVGEAAVAGEVSDTQAATTEVPEGATADPTTAEADPTTAEAAQVEDAPGTEVEAATAEMSPEALAEAAQVAGLETARANQAKRQLRRAGLSEAEIEDIGDNPEKLEEKVGDFTEEQLDMVGGLPEEALVSSQMEQLLKGIDEGKTPSWARPAVESVESMLARRGMSASTVGRDSLTNAIIQSAMPIAQQNAQQIQQSVSQRKERIQQGAITQAQLEQQATLQNAQNTFNLQTQNLSNEQQAEIANSEFMRTVKLTEANNRQQAAIQNAANLNQLEAQELEWNARLEQQNAQAFLQTNLANLNNEQQAAMVDTQYEQQRMLSQASAENARRQFNAESENQVKQFMTQLQANMQQFNSQQKNAMAQFNATEQNRLEAQQAGNEIQAQQFNAQLANQVDQFNAQQELQTQQWNASNAQAIEQSNIQWRRQANTAETAAQNAINQQNAQNAFSLTQQAQASLWQELRDKAQFDFQSYENQQDREAQLYATAIGNESAASNSYDQTTHLTNLASSFFGGGGNTSSMTSGQTSEIVQAYENFESIA